MLRWSDVALCYLMLLNRLPDEREIAEGKPLDVGGLLSKIVSRRDPSRDLFLSYHGSDPGQRHELATRTFYEYVAALGEEKLMALGERIGKIPRKVVSGHDYVAFHTRRMLELFGFLGRWHGEHPVGSLLDIGMSPFFALYSKTIPGVEAFLVDCWPLSKSKLDEIGAAGFWKVDLNKEWMSPSRGGKLNRRFDMIVFTEVIEHLLIDPVEAIEDLLALLNPGGVIYFSTPNYLNSGAIHKLLDFTNPQPRYSKAVGNADAHYHLREYTMRELEEAVRRAGGKLIFHAFSDCWDRDLLTPEDMQALPIPLRSNLILIVGKEDDESLQGEAEREAQAPSGDWISSEEIKAAVARGMDMDSDQVVDINAGLTGTVLDRLSFDEVWYLQNNPDVAMAVKAGGFASGWEHYDQFGRREGRRVRRRLIRVEDK